MSNANDVHLARVSKIQRSTEMPKGGPVVNSNNQRFEKGVREIQTDLKRHTDEGNFLFGSISPRAGTTSLSQEVESPDHTQRDTNESDNNISSCSTLDIGKVENLSLLQLETQVRDLSQRLRLAEEQRTEMQHQLEKSNAEKEVCFRRLEVISSAHECRITEMHCVIAELSKKLRAKQESTILEEQEPEGSELSFQDGSIYNSELNLTNPDAECQTDPLDGGDYSTGEGFVNMEDHICVESNDLKANDTSNKGQVEALQEEVFHLKAQIALLQSEVADSLRLGTDQNNVVVEERQNFEYFGAEFEANESNCSLERLCFANRDQQQQNLNNLNKGTRLELIPSFQSCDAVTSPKKEHAIPKMAERVKLRCASKHEIKESITAMDLRNSEFKSSEIVEHLVADLKQNHSMLESFTEPNQLDNELKRLLRKVDHLKVRNTVLSLTLDECKEHCEHLYLLCGKYESNAIALQSAVNCSDRAIEAYDVMLALLESKLALMKDRSTAAEESRKAVESVARHLLDRFESERNTCENSLGPWQNTFSIPDKVCTPWTAEDDNRLRYHVSKLKGRRSTVQNTIVNLESPFSDLYEKSRMTLESNKELECREKTVKMDLEMAVLMQELLNLREENISLKTKLDESCRERQYAVDRAGILEDALKQLTVDSHPLFHQDRHTVVLENRISYSEAEHAALTEQQLVEALTRESELKGRIQTLIASVSASQKMSDEKYEQLHNNIHELQNSNLSMGQLLEQTKRKYQTRTRKLEQKIMEMSLELGRQAGSSVGCSDAPIPRRPVKNEYILLVPPNVEHVPETTL